MKGESHFFIILHKFQQKEKMDFKEMYILSIFLTIFTIIVYLLT